MNDGTPPPGADAQPIDMIHGQNLPAQLQAVGQQVRHLKIDTARLLWHTVNTCVGYEETSDFIYA